MKIPAKLKYLPVAALVAGLTAPAIGAGSRHSSDTPNTAGLYKEFCAQCHGASGKGDGPQAASLKTRIHSFSDCEWMAMRSGATLFLVIKKGSGVVGLLPEMPPFDDKLDDQQITDLVHYVRGFCLHKMSTSPGP